MSKIISFMHIYRIRVVSPQKVSRFTPLHRYYIIIDEVFFDNFWVIIYLLVVCKKNNNSFIFVYFNYLLISCIQKIIIIHSCWSTFVKDLKRNSSCKIYKKTHKFFFFAPTQKYMKWLRCCTSAQITSFLMNYASNAKIV